MADNITQFESVGGFSGANLFVSGATFTGNVAMNSTSSHTGLASFAGGITAAGATFMGNINLQNAEFIRNTTNGRIDFMPAPSSATAFGLSVDLTTWTYGPRFGTIKSSDGALNNAQILFDVPLTTGNDTNFNFGNSSAYWFRMNSTGNDTLFIATPCGVNGYSSAVALMDYAASYANGNRNPGTVHSHPNLYIYSAGAANANDFIRFEHDRTNANIVTGQTSGILIQPGSGWLGVSGGISASGATFSGTIALNGQTFTNVVSSVNGLTGAISSLSAPAGLTSSTAVYTFPNGVTAYSTGSIPYYTSPYFGSRAVGTSTLTPNRTYFILHQAPRAISLKNIRIAANSPSVAMNLYLSVWTVNSLTGLPQSRLYVSGGLTANASTFNYVTVTNASGLVSVPAGPFYMAITVGGSLPTYTHSNDRNINLYGSDNYVIGYQNYAPVLDTNGFTAPTSITQAGTTFAFVNYISAVAPTPIIEWNHV